MRQYNHTDENIVIEGVYGFEVHGRFRRYTDGIVAAYPRLAEFDRRCTGARVRFCTDSPTVKVEIKVSNQFVDRGMSFYQANAAYAYVGDYAHARYAALLSADNTYDSDAVSAEFANDGMNDITVFFPRNPTVEAVNVWLEDGAVLLPPTPHKLALPFVFYGSSITEQGHTATPVAYPSLLSRFFDADFYNFGASGNALGEPEIAEYLGKIPKSVFFYDYDHNAPTAEHLRATHEAFFRIFRQHDPLSPVVMTSRPADDGPETEERAAIVKQTYENAARNGDKNVYFIDGRTLFGNVDPNICTTDRTHPNDLGHYLMAKTLAEYVARRLAPLAEK